jgi:hemoglobin
MKNLIFLAVAVLVVAAFSCASPESTEESAATTAPAAEVAAEPTADEKVAELDAMCAGAADAMKARHEAQPLYERLGGRDAIHAVVEDVVRRHQENDQIKHLMEGVDTANLVEQVTDFLSAGFGGDVDYTGRDMVTAHEHLALSNVEFLAAGADVGAAMSAAGVGEDEQQEVLCAFVGLRTQVVTR